MKKIMMLIAVGCVIYAGLWFSSEKANPPKHIRSMRTWDVGINGVVWGDDRSSYNNMKIEMVLSSDKICTRGDFLLLDENHKEELFYVFANGIFSGIVTIPKNDSDEYHDELLRLLEYVFGSGTSVNNAKGAYRWKISKSVSVFLSDDNSIAMRYLKNGHK